MKKVISYSLWGNDRKYTIGAIRNIALAKQLYPGWKIRFYVDVSVPTSTISQINEEGTTDVEVVEIDVLGDYQSLFWRLQPLWEDDIEITLIRDADSRLSLRERICVDEWLNSDKGIHTMFDHPYHDRMYGIMPGMSGFKKGVYQSIKYDIDIFLMSSNKFNYGCDYKFFMSVYNKKIKSNIMIHDSIKPGVDGALNFPRKREGLEFVGKIYDHCDRTILEHEEILRKWIALNEK